MTSSPVFGSATSGLTTFVPDGRASGPPLERAFDALAKAVGEMEAVSGHLAVRLESVLAEGPETVDAALDRADHQGSPLLRRVSEVTDRVRAASDRMSALLSRLEV